MEVLYKGKNVGIKRSRGYLHSIQFAKPSLVCDIQEITLGHLINAELQYIVREEVE